MPLIPLRQMEERSLIGVTLQGGDNATIMDYPYPIEQVERVVDELSMCIADVDDVVEVQPFLEALKYLTALKVVAKKARYK